jgi:maltose O-acetyltransferase
MLNQLFYCYIQSMSEFEKMISGQMYNASDPELTAMRARVRDLLTELNSTAQDTKTSGRLDLCSKIFGTVAGQLWLQPPFYCDYGRNILIGNNVFINFNCIFLDVAPITIGEAVKIGPNVQLYTATHPLNWQQRREGQEYGKPITIGNDVWIGGGAIICPGVTVGEKSVIGAGTVVTKNVPAGVVIAGNPGKVLKQV